MSNKLVAYFSATGTTKKLAENLANCIGADLYEIIPEEPYTNADLNWMDKNSRSSIEMKDDSSRPAIKEKVNNIDQYDTIYVGFPIWWYTAPTIINTFLESYNLEGKTIIPFATSGGSGMGNTSNDLKTSAPNATVLEGKKFSASVSESELRSWADSNKNK